MPCVPKHGLGGVTQGPPQGMQLPLPSQFPDEHDAPDCWNN